MTDKIIDDIKSTCSISELRIARDSGTLSPEVIEMCEHHLDEMVAAVEKRIHDKNLSPTDFKPMVSTLKSNPDLLRDVMTFEDSYEEILEWNKLISAHQLNADVTTHHREADIALFDSIMHRSYAITKEFGHALSKLIWLYPQAK